ncbi:MAG TPA: tetratricopeptide repeat protein [Chthoniobacteraceae bacterium]|nr:tetratricopeptide repeat protein [Chthoniobacteraceae bacterium]
MSRNRAAYLTLAVTALLVPSASAQDMAGVDKSQAALMAQIYNEALQAFQRGEWGPAASGFAKLIAMVPNEGQAQIAPAYLTMGAAYYNMPNFPKAIEVFSGFIKQFPNSERLLDAKMALGQTYLAAKNYPEAIKVYAELEATPALRDQALTFQALAYKLQNKKEEAIRILEKLIAGGLKTTAQANGGVMLIELYVDKGETAKASVLLETLQSKIAIIDNLVTLNTVAFKLADGFYDKKMYKEAIACYRLVRPREDVIKFQTDRLALMERWMKANSTPDPRDPGNYLKAQQNMERVKNAAAESKALLEEFLKLPDYGPSLMFRIARCWYDWDKKWEALVVFRRLLDEFPKTDEREMAMFEIVVVLADLNRTKSAQAACEAYLKEYPEGENAGTVGYMSGAVALQAGDYGSAESFFTTMLEKQPKSTYRGTMIYLLGNAKFAQGRYEEANVEYAKYIQAYPEGKTDGEGLFGIGDNHAEECMFRIAVSHVFLGQYEKALELLREYQKKYPKGFYLADAKYRIAICFYAASQFEEVAKQCEAWVKEFPEHEMEGEVQALLGDAYGALNRKEEAIPAYVRSYKRAGTDEVLNYSLFEASKYMQKLGRWDDVGRLFAEFVEAKPDHPSVVTAMYWIAKAKARTGQVEQAKKLMVENLKKYVTEPKREGVEQLLSQLAQVCSKRTRQLAPVAEAPGGEVASRAEAAEPPPFDPFDELEQWLKPLEEGANPMVKARLLFARAEMASIKKQDAQREKILLEMSERFKPEELSPPLLALVGDFLLAKGETDRATVLYEKMREDFPKSDHLDVAYVGLGEIAFAKKDYAKALQLFSDALDKVTASMKMKEATLGKARTLLELGKFDESKKLFEQVASIREWRGDATAQAIYSLGEIEARQNRYNEAIAYYRRVFVAYQKYLPWVARSYLKAAETFDKMGKRQDAIDNLRDMLRNERLQPLPEFQQAQRQLRDWGVGQG